MGGEYFIWSNEHRAFWRPNSCGYTRNLYEAGHYSRADALALCCGPERVTDGIPDEIPVRVTDIEEMRGAMAWPMPEPTGPTITEILDMVERGGSNCRDR
jgi:hypothetical protein